MDGFEKEEVREATLEIQQTWSPEERANRVVTGKYNAEFCAAFHFLLEDFSQESVDIGPKGTIWGVYT